MQPMHILLGTLVGAGFAALTVVAFAMARGKTPVLQHVLLAALGGAVAGAVTTATLGAGGTTAAGLGHEVVAFAIGGGSGGVAERLGENVMEDRDLGDGVVTSAALGAAVGLVSLGAAKGLQTGLSRYTPKAWQSTGPPTTLLRKLLAAKTTGTGGSWLRGARAPGTGRGFRRIFDRDDREARSEVSSELNPELGHSRARLPESGSGLPKPSQPGSASPIQPPETRAPETQASAKAKEASTLAKAEVSPPRDGLSQALSVAR